MFFICSFFGMVFFSYHQRYRIFCCDDSALRRYFTNRACISQWVVKTPNFGCFSFLWSGFWKWTLPKFDWLSRLWGIDNFIKRKGSKLRHLIWRVSLLTRKWGWNLGQQTFNVHCLQYKIFQIRSKTLGERITHSLNPNTLTILTILTLQIWNWRS